MEFYKKFLGEDDLEYVNQDSPKPDNQELDNTSSPISFGKLENCSFQEINKEDPIDFVFTYVDSSDKNYLKVLKHWYKKEGDVIVNKKINFDDRYFDFNELYFSLLFLKKYAGFIRNIYIVTPTTENLKKYFDSHDNIFIIDDREILPPEIINPCFRSTVVESFLHKIPDISDNFLYACDDMFIGNYITMDDLLTENDVPFAKVEGYRVSYNDEEKHKNIPFRMDIIRSNLLIHKKFDILPKLCHNHQIIFFRKEVCEITHSLFKDEIIANGQYRFRFPTHSNLHFALLQQFVGILYGYYEVLQSTRKDSLGFYPYNQYNPWKRFYGILKEKPKFFCINYLNEKYLFYLYHLVLQYHTNEINSIKSFILVTKEENILNNNKYLFLEKYLNKYGNVSKGLINSLPIKLCQWKKEGTQITWNNSKIVKDSSVDKVKVIYCYDTKNSLKNFTSNKNYDIILLNINEVEKVIPELNYLCLINFEDTVTKKEELFFKPDYKHVLNNQINIIFRKDKIKILDNFYYNYPKKILNNFQIAYPE